VGYATERYLQDGLLRELDYAIAFRAERLLGGGYSDFLCILNIARKQRETAAG
jgi:hypothetical protein